MTGEMHLAMAEAFGGFGGRPRRRVGDAGRFHRGAGPPPGARLAAGGRPLAGAAPCPSATPARPCRPTATTTSGQVMRTDAGWYVLDFEGEPSRPLEERQRPTSVLKDVAGMLRSFNYASRFAVGERGRERPGALRAVRPGLGGPQPVPPSCGATWSRKGTEELLPPAPEDRGAVRVAFEVDKALYELAYEQAFRPDWAGYRGPPWSACCQRRWPS